MERRRVPVWTWLAGLIGVLLLMPVLFHAVWNVAAGRALARTRAALEAQGLPMTVEDIRPPALPEERNAAPLLLQAFVRSESLPGELAERVGDWAYFQDGLKHGNLVTFSAEQRAAAREELAAAPGMEALLALLQQAAARPGCDFQLEYEQGPMLLLPHLNKIRGVVRVLAVHSWLAADAGDAETAVKDLRTALRVSAHLAPEPILISQLVGMAGDGIALRCLQRLWVDFPALRPSEADMEALVAELARHRELSRSAMVRAIDGERVLTGGWCFDQFLGDDPASALRAFPGVVGGGRLPPLLSQPAVAWLVIYVLRPAIKDDCRYYLERMAEYRTLEPGTPTPDPPAAYLISRMILMGCRTFVERLHESQARLDLARLGVALELWRRQHGDYPERLEALAGLTPMPMDPFSGGPYSYDVGAVGCRLQSKGLERERYRSPGKPKPERRHLAWCGPGAEPQTSLPLSSEPGN